MPYAKLHDGYESNPKTQLVDLVAGAAVALHSKALAHCARQLTDGRISDAWVRGQLALLRPKQRREVLDRVLKIGLIERATDGDGFVVHDYLDYNNSRHEVETDRRDAAQRQASARAKRAQQQLPWNLEGAVA